jgi:uroporphyrinogen-III synthase
VEHLVGALRASGLARLIPRIRWASIGPVTSRTVRQAGGRVAVEARTATIEGLVNALHHGVSRATITKTATI